MSARDVIDLALVGRGYDRTEGTAHAILSALAAAGYVVAPVEATEAILRAAAKLDWSSQTDPTWREIYAAMLASSQEDKG